MSYFETIFKINYIYVHLTRLTRTKRYRQFFRHTNRVYKVALIIIVYEILHADVNKSNINFFNRSTSDETTSTIQKNDSRI